MNPNTNRFEQLNEDPGPSIEHLKQQLKNLSPSDKGALLRPDGSPVPAHWSIYSIGELVMVKNYTFRVAYIGEQTLLLEPVAPVLVNKP